MRRARRSRVRRVGKWAGLVVVVLLVGLWGVSIGWSFARVWPGSSMPSQRLQGHVDVYLSSLELDAGTVFYGEGIGVKYVPIGAPRPRPYWSVAPRWGPLLWWPRWERTGASLVGYLPLWMPLVLFGGGTGLLWWRDWGAVGAGCCRGCGYDMEGIEGGVCPECGENSK